MYANSTAVNGQALAWAMGGMEAVAVNDYCSEAAVGVPFDALIDEPVVPIDTVGVEHIPLGGTRFADHAPIFAAPRSSSGGSSSIGAPGAPASGGNGDGDGGGFFKPGEMSANAVRCDLLALSMGRRPALLLEEFEFLLARGFVEMMTPEEYDRSERGVLHLSLVEDDLVAAREDLGRLYMQRRDLVQEQDSVTHRLAQLFNGGLRQGVVDDASALSDLDGRIAAKKAEIEEIGSSLDGLKARKKRLDGFVRTRDWGYLGLTEAGRKMLELLREYAEFTDGLTLSEFEDDVSGI